MECRSILVPTHEIASAIEIAGHSPSRRYLKICQTTIANAMRGAVPKSKPATFNHLSPDALLALTGASPQCGTLLHLGRATKRWARSANLPPPNTPVQPATRPAPLSRAITEAVRNTLSFIDLFHHQSPAPQKQAAGHKASGQTTLCRA